MTVSWQRKIYHIGGVEMSLLEKERIVTRERCTNGSEYRSHLALESLVTENQGSAGLENQLARLTLSLGTGRLPHQQYGACKGVSEPTPRCCLGLGGPGGRAEGLRICFHVRDHGPAKLHIVGRRDKQSENMHTLERRTCQAMPIMWPRGRRPSRLVAACKTELNRRGVQVALNRTSVKKRGDPVN